MLMLMVSVVGWVLGVLLARRAARNLEAEQVPEDSDGVRGFRGPKGYRGSMDHPVHQAPRVVPNGQHRGPRYEMWE